MYDATRELNWHPDVQAAKLGHAGRVHQDASDEFASIHDGYAVQKLNECILGTVTEKAAAFMKKNAEIKAKDLAQSSKGDDGLALQKHRWVPVHLKDRKRPSKTQDAIPSLFRRTKMRWARGLVSISSW